MVAILRSIAADPESPATARVNAARTLLVHDPTAVETVDPSSKAALALAALQNGAEPPTAEQAPPESPTPEPVPSAIPLPEPSPSAE